MACLQPQLTPDVEVLTELDDREHSIGWKRNNLLSRATGDYVVFVDDDDMVAPDYIRSIMQGIDMGVDVIAIQGIFTIDGQRPSPFVDIPYQGHGLSMVGDNIEFKRGLQHLDAIKRDIALSVEFPDSSFTEDYVYGTTLERSGIVKTWHCIDHAVYFYDYRTDKVRNDKCKLAVIVPCFNHDYTSSKSIESLLANTSTPDFCLIMVDDGSSDETPSLAADLNERLGPHRFIYHRNVTNLGVNASWNKGLEIAFSRGAEYIAINNNDLMYAPGWDLPLINSLLDSSIGVISPLSTYGRKPLDWPKGGGRDVNPAGYRGYMPILGACFMATAATFKRLGPFPSELKIYFGDNWLVVAAQAAGLQCGYDNESYVHHWFCITTSKLDNDKLWASDGPAFDAIEAKFGFRMEPYAPPPEGTAPIRPNAEVAMAAD